MSYEITPETERSWQLTKGKIVIRTVCPMNIPLNFGGGYNWVIFQDIFHDEILTIGSSSTHSIEDIYQLLLARRRVHRSILCRSVNHPVFSRMLYEKSKLLERFPRELIEEIVKFL